MNFSYLNLPSLPAEFIRPCLDNIGLEKIDSTLIELNKKEGVSHSITWLPTHVKEWIIKNIVSVIDPDGVHPELITKTVLHINKYIEHPEGNGVHPIHIDYGRRYAFNYILTPGADTLPTTSWYMDDKKTLIEEYAIEAGRWHLLAVNPQWHGVRGQEPGKLRTIISLCYDPLDSCFDPTQHFKHLLVP